MPFESKSQRRWFYRMMNLGKISKQTVEKCERHTPKDKPLPERVRRTMRRRRHAK